MTIEIESWFLEESFGSFRYVHKCYKYIVSVKTSGGAFGGNNF